MSIFSKLAGVVVGAATGFAAGGPLGAVVGGASTLVASKAPQAPRAAPRPTVGPGGGGQREFLTQASLGQPPALPVLSRVPQLGQGAIRPPTRELAFSGGACPVGFHLDKRTRSFCVRNRRMNPLNGKAANRAIRRIKGARKMLQKIERQLPRAKARATPRHGHRTTVTAV